MLRESYDGPCKCLCHDHEEIHITPCCAYTGEPRAIAEEKARIARETLGEDRTNEQPKYSVSQRVKVNGWCGHDFGIIKDIKRTYHHRMGEWVWGYRIQYENNGPGLTALYVPQGYLESCDSKVAA